MDMRSKPSLSNVKSVSFLLVSLLFAGCGGAGYEAHDDSPAAFDIPPVENVEPSTWIELGPFLISDIDVSVEALASLGELKVDEDVYRTGVVSVQNGQSIYIRVLSAAASSDVAEGILTVGAYSTSYTIKTGLFDIDNDGIGDNLDPDKDGDGVLNADDTAPGDPSIQHVLRWVDSMPEPKAHAINNAVFSNHVIADVNDDGIPDIVSEYAGTLSWRKGLGKGEFATKVEITDNKANYIYREYLAVPFQVVDVDQDGKLDVVGFAREGAFIVRYAEATGWTTTDQSTLAFRVIELNGENYFLNIGALEPVNKTLPVITLAPCEGIAGVEFAITSRIATGDFWGTGEHALIVNLDFAYHVFRKKSDNLYECEEYSLITYGEKEDFNEFAFYVTTIVGEDVDHDGRTEIIVAHESTANAPMVNLGKLEFEDFGISSRALDRQAPDDLQQRFAPAAYGDLDNDGDIDFAMAVKQDNTLKINLYFNQGYGVFSREDFTPLEQGEPGHLAMGDINQDGIVDILSSQYWFEIKPYREISIYPGYTHTLDVKAVSDDGKTLTYTVQSTHSDWFVINADGKLDIDVPANVTRQQDYVDVTVSVTDGASKIYRRIRVYLSVSENDFDGDGVVNEQDIFPHDSQEWFDYDGDGIGDNSDSDRDNDGIPTLYDDDDLNVDIGSENIWKNGHNTFLTLALPISINGRNVSELVVADVYEDKIDDVVYINSDQRGVSQAHFSPQREAVISPLYDSPENCKVERIIANPMGGEVLLAEYCGEGISNIFSLNLKAASVTPVASVVGGLETAGYLRLFAREQYVLVKVEVGRLFYFDRLQNNWIDSGVIIDGLYSLRDNDLSVRSADINGDGLDDFVVTGDDVDVYLNLGGQFQMSNDFHFFPTLFPFSIQFLQDSEQRLVYDIFSPIGLNVVTFDGENVEVHNVCQLRDLAAGEYPGICLPVKMMDVNQDGELDLVGLGHIWEGNGNYQYSPMLNAEGDFTNEVSGRFRLQGDFDGDGVDDFLSERQSGFSGFQQYVSFWQGTPRYSRSSAEPLVWDEALVTSNAVTYQIVPGLDSEYFTVDRTTGQVQFSRPDVIPQDKLQFQTWLEVLTYSGKTRKLLQVQIPVGELH